ncbi:MAG: hypothetical protein ACRDGA_11720 [Bacteroidota bacterium]
MKRTRKAATIALIAFLISPRALAQSLLTLRIIYDKTEFLKAENVPLGLELTNTGTSELRVAPLWWFTGGLEVKLFDARGEELEYTGPVWSVSQSEPINLKPGESILRIMNVLEMFGLYISMASEHKYLEKGEYTLQVKYKSGLGDNLSSEETFTVVEPKDEEAGAYELFMHTLREAGGGRSIRSPQQFVAQLSELETRYPNSIYVPIALPILSAWYQISLKDQQKANELCVRLVEKYPSFVLVKSGIFDSVLKRITDPIQRRSYVLQLQARVKGPLAERLYKERLLKLEQ